MKAYKKDIEENPDMMGSHITEMANAKNADIVLAGDKNKKNNSDEEEETAKPTKKWKEVKTADGKSYYWNLITQGIKLFINSFLFNTISPQLHCSKLTQQLVRYLN